MTTRSPTSKAASGGTGGAGANPREGADHHVEIKGRKWRATDPAIPPKLRQELVDELMDARRAVAAGNRADDEAAIAAARARVQHAKVALGERGPEWWVEHPRDASIAERIEAALHAVLHHRAPESTTCPSDLARIAGGPGWRKYMDLARDVAARLHDDGVVELRQGGARVADPRDLHGPVRIGRGAGFPA